LELQSADSAVLKTSDSTTSLTTSPSQTLITDNSVPTPYNPIKAVTPEAAEKPITAPTEGQIGYPVFVPASSIKRTSVQGAGDVLKQEGGQYINTSDIASLARSSRQSGIDRSKLITWKELAIEKELGRGAYGVVYKAEFRTSSVAVKELLKVNAETSSAFTQEAEVWARLKTHAVKKK